MFAFQINMRLQRHRGPGSTGGCISYRNPMQYWCSEARGSWFLQCYHTCHKKLFQNHMRSDTTACPPAAQAPVWVPGFIKTADIKLVCHVCPTVFKNPLTEEGQHKLGWIQLWLGMSTGCKLLQIQRQMHSAFPKAEIKSQMKRWIEPFSCSISVCSQQDLNSKLWSEGGAQLGCAQQHICAARAGRGHCCGYWEPGPNGLKSSLQSDSYWWTKLFPLHLWSLIIFKLDISKVSFLHGPPLVLDGMAGQALSPQVKNTPMVIVKGYN